MAESIRLEDIMVEKFKTLSESKLLDKLKLFCKKFQEGGILILKLENVNTDVTKAQYCFSGPQTGHKDWDKELNYPNISEILKDYNKELHCIICLMIENVSAMKIVRVDYEKSQ